MGKTFLSFVVAIAMLWPAAVHAGPIVIPGSPNSSDAGFGVHLNLAGRHIQQSLRAAGILQLDWVAVDLDWASSWPDASTQPDIARLDAAMQFAGQNKLSVLLRLWHAPEWARSGSGPDPERTAWFVSNLVKRYAGILQAIELFPQANTEYGWGTAPDPNAYSVLIKTVADSLRETGVFLVAAGLTPLPSPQPSNLDIDDLVFLQDLYSTGTTEYLPVVSMCLPLATGGPLQSPRSEEHRVLRHYEEIRQVMLANDHESGLIWITQFNLPSGKINNNDVSYNNLSGQVQWMNQAYHQLRSQLYIGVAFLTDINPPAATTTDSDTPLSLINADLSQHPFYQKLKELAAISSPTKVILLDFNKPQSKNIVKVRESPP
jgi:hypothetical protein